MHLKHTTKEYMHVSHPIHIHIKYEGFTVNMHSIAEFVHTTVQTSHKHFHDIDDIVTATLIRQGLFDMESSN